MRVLAPLFFGLVLFYFAIALIGIVWLLSLSIYNKLSDVTDIAGISYQEHRNLEVEVHSRLNHFWLRAIFLGALAFGMYLPKLLTDSGLQPPNWAIPVGLSCLAVGLYTFQGLWRELEEIRSLKSYVKQIERREADRKSQLAELNPGIAKDWDQDSKLDGFRDPKSN